MQSVWERVKAWLLADGRQDDRVLRLSHGGDGGRWYAVLVDHDTDETFDGAGDTPEAAIDGALGAVQAGL